MRIMHDNVNPPLYWAEDEYGNRIPDSISFSEEETHKLGLGLNWRQYLEEV